MLAATGIVLGKSASAALPRLTRLSAVHGWLLAAAAAAIALSYLSAAVGLRAAAGVPLPLGRTVLVQLAAALANRVVPGGAGGMAVNGRYLTRSGLTGPAAGVAVGAVALANGAAGALLLAASSPGVLLNLQHRWRPASWQLVLAGGLVAGLLVAALVLRRRWAAHRARLRAWWTEGRGAAVRLVRDPRRLAALLAGSFGVRLAHVLALLAALSAFSVRLPVLLVVAVYLGSSAAASLIPTPSGLGSVEAILVAALVAVGGATTTVLAAVLTFRALSFWLPIVPGLAASWTLRRRLAL